MEDFNSFAKNGGEKKGNGKKENKNGALPEELLSALGMMQQKYEGKSESDLIEAIISEATRRRKSGGLSDAELDGFIGALRPILNAEQRKKLDKIIEKIKKIN